MLGGMVLSPLFFQDCAQYGRCADDTFARTTSRPLCAAHIMTRSGLRLNASQVTR
jgi:hypothetical protein